MAISFDQAFGIHEKALSLRAKRTEILASNLANADTPNFKAKDFDFKAALGQAEKSMNNSKLNVSSTNVKHLSLSTEALNADSLEMKYRNPISPSMDGNTVEVNQEQAAFAENSMQYQVSLSFLSSRIQNLMMSIKGGS